MEIEKKVRKGLKTKKEKRIKMIKSKGIEILKYVKKIKMYLCISGNVNVRFFSSSTFAQHHLHSDMV